MPLCRHSVGTCQETSSHATRQGTLSHSRLSALSHCGSILAKEVNKCAGANFHPKKKKKKCAWKHSLPNPGNNTVPFVRLSESVLSRLR